MAVHCKFRNSTNKQILVGCFGQNPQANLRMTLAVGEIDQYDLFEGFRVLVVWDEFTDQIDFTGPFKVDTTANGGKNRFDFVNAAGGSVTVTATYNVNDNSY